MKKLLMAVLTLSALGCSWVDVSSEGEMVQVKTPAQVGDCKRIGSANSQVLDKLAFVKRSAEKQAKELTTLARNEAAKLGGNTVVAESAIEDGSQRFGVYQCP